MTDLSTLIGRSIVTVRALGLALCGLAPAALEARAAEESAQPELGARVVSLLRVDGALFKDLNKNGTLDAYEDWRRPVAERVFDLVSQMTLEEKAGLMVGPSLAMGPGGTVSEQPVYGVNPFSGGPVAMVSPGTTDALHKRHIVQSINRQNTEPRTMATWLNAVQELAEGRRLGTHARPLRHEPAQPLRGPGHLRDRRSGERLLAVAGPARPRGHPRPRAGRSSPGSPRRSTSPWESAARLPSDGRGRDRAALGRFRETLGGSGLGRPGSFPRRSGRPGRRSPGPLRESATGRLPFELPSSMDAVRAQLEDLPHDSKAPLFTIGSGLTYPAAR